MVAGGVRTVGRFVTSLEVEQWTKDVLRDWASGMAMAIAETEEEARRLLQESLEGNAQDFDGPPDEVRDIDKPSAYHKWGGA